MKKILTDKQWKALKPHLPKPASTGRPRCDDRTTIDGMLHVLTVGCKWSDMPKMYGSKSSIHRRFQEYQQKGIWKKILKATIRSAYRQNKLKLRSVSVDSTSVPAKKKEM